MAAQSPSYANGIQSVSPPLVYVEIDGPGPQDTRFQVGGGTVNPKMGQVGKRHVLIVREEERFGVIR